jgi:hypothetical protein
MRVRTLAIIWSAVLAACSNVQVDTKTGEKRSWPFQITGQAELLTIRDLEAIVVIVKPELAKKGWPKISSVDIVSRDEADVYPGNQGTFFVVSRQHGKWKLDGEGIGGS